MLLKKLTPNLMVEDVNRTVAFYNNVLGFELVMAVPENSQEVLIALPRDKQLIYAMLKCGNIEIMFQAKDSLAGDMPVFKDREVGGSLTFYIEVENIAALYSKLKEKVSVIKELHTTFYGMREFYIQDCNGYILGFAEPILRK